MEKILEKELEELGVELDEVMERFIGDEDLYFECMEQFVQDPAFGKLGESLGIRDYEEAFSQAHSLKGVSGNLGLTKMYQAVCEIVEPLRKKEYDNIEQNYVLVMQQLESVRSVVGLYKRL